ncbi:MAG: hypothetical protein ABH851_00070 [Methanobacteriota archaeon]
MHKENPPSTHVLKPPAELENLFSGLTELPAFMNFDEGPFSARYGPCFIAGAEGVFGRISLALYRNLKYERDSLIFNWRPQEEGDGVHIEHNDLSVPYPSRVCCTSSHKSANGQWSHGIDDAPFDKREPTVLTYARIATLLIPRMRFRGFDSELLEEASEGEILAEMARCGLPEPEQLLQQFQNSAVDCLTGEQFDAVYRPPWREGQEQPPRLPRKPPELTEQ